MKIKFGDSSLNLKAGGSLANIDRGPRGYSAYEIAVQEGFVGTEEEWLASLVGPEGKQGKDGERGLEGPRGKEGPEGKQGIPGYTPVKGVDYFTEEDIESLNIPEKVSDLDNDSGYINKSVNNLVNYTLKTNTGSLIDLSIDNTNYVVTLKLKNQDGTAISTDTIDLPLESVVVGGSYDKINKKIVLTLENGNTVDIPVGDLIAGLQTEITSVNKLASDLVDDTNSGNKFTNLSEKQTWNNKYDRPSSGIPATDLSSGVQTSLGKADTALQEHQDLTDYVKNTDYAADNKGGVTKNGNAFVVTNTNGVPYCSSGSYAQYQSSGNGRFISKGTLENVITGKKLVNQDALVQSQEVQDTNIEENASNIDWLQSLVNQMPHVSGQGTDLSLENVLNYRLMKFLPQGVSSQFSTTGKNLLSLNDIEQTTKNGVTYSCSNGILKLNGTATGGVMIEFNNVVIPAGTYMFSSSITNPNGSGSYARYITSQSGSNLKTNGGEVTLTEDTSLHFRFYTNSGAVFNNATVIAQLELGSTATSYEPYTGGMPAPNPDYPEEVKNVTGDNSLKIINKNLFIFPDTQSVTGNGITSIYSNNKLTYSGTATGTYTNATPLRPFKITAGTYTISFENALDVGFQIRFQKTTRYADGGTNITMTKGNKKTTFTLTEDYNYAYLILTFANGDTVSGSTGIQIVKGSTAPSTYVEHEEQNYQLSLGTENLLQNNLTSGTENGITYVVNADKSVTLNGTSTAITWLILNRSVTLEAGTYTMSSSYSGNDVRIYSTGLGVYTLDGQRTKTKTTSVSGDVSINIASGTTCNNLTIKPMIQKGSKATSYSPYGIIPIELNSTPDGTIRDAIIGKPNEWYKREYIGKVVLNGSETWYLNSNVFNLRSLTDYKNTQIGEVSMYCNKYLAKGNVNGSVNAHANGNYTSCFLNDNATPRLFIRDDRYTTVNDYKTYLQTEYNNGTPVIVDYVKGQYTDIPITDTTLINQLNDIYNNAHSYNGTTNITTTYEDGNEQMYLDIELLKNVWEVTE